MEHIIYGFISSAGIYLLTLIFLATAFKHRRKLNTRKMAAVTLTGLVVTCMISYISYMILPVKLYQYMAVALMAAMMVLVCIAIFRCSVMEGLFVYFLVKNLTDVIFMVSKFIQVYLVMKIAHTSAPIDFIIAYSLTALIAQPLIYLFMSRLIRPCIDITEGMPFWKLLWMLPVLYYIIYKMGISPDYPSPEFIWSETVIALPVIWGVGTTLTYIVVVRALTNIAKLTEDRERLRASRQQIKLQQEQYGRLQDSIEETARMRHDWRQQIVLLQGYAQNDDCSSIRSYLEKYEQEVRGVSICENFAVDSIAQHYISKAQRHGIDVIAAFHIPSSFPAREEDLCVVLGNLLENAVDACMRQEAGERYINVDISAMGNSSMAIVIENSYSGEVREKNGVYLSSKRDGEGIGISSVCNIVEKNNGVVKFECGQGVFKVSILMKFDKSERE